MNIYQDDIQALIEGTLGVLDMCKGLKNAEDLDGDVMSYILAIEAIDDWADNDLLAGFYDLLRIIQQEVVFGRPIIEFQSCNLYAVVAYANLLFTPGMTISCNVLRAHELLQEVLAVDPNCEYALATLASLLIDGGEGLPRDPARAFDLYTKVLSTRPDYSFVLAKLGEFLRLGDIGIKQDETLAHHYFLRAVDADSKNLQALESLGILYRHGFGTVAASPKKAYEYFSKVLEVDPYSPYSLSSVAELLVNEYEGVPSDEKRAYELLQDALSISPNFVMALCICGELLRTGGNEVECDRVRALQLLERASILDPSYGGVFAGLGELYFYSSDGIERDEEKATKYFTEAYNLGNRSTLCLNHLAELSIKSDLDRASELALMSLQENPMQAYPLWILGCVFHYKGDPISLVKSKDYFEKALECDPNHYPSLIYLGCAFAKSPFDNLKKRACELLESALEIMPENSELWVDLARLYYFEEKNLDIPRAVEYLRRAISLDGESSSSHSLLGYIIVKEEIEDCFVEALEHFEKAFHLNVDDSCARFYLCRAYIYGSNGMPPNYERARVLIDEYLTTDPQDSDFLELQNILLERMIGIKQSAFVRAKGFFKRMAASLKRE